MPEPKAPPAPQIQKVILPAEFPGKARTFPDPVTPRPNPPPPPPKKT